MAEVKWIKLYIDMFNNKKIKYIRTLPDGNDIVLVWIMLIASAGTCNTNGYIFITENIPYTPEALASEFDIPVNTLKLALDVLMRLEMINVDEQGILISNWEEYQNADKLEAIREYNRLAKKRQREEKAQKQLGQGQCQGQVFDCQDTDKELELDIDIDIDKDIKIKKNKNNFDDLIKNFSDNKDLQKTINAFVKMRKTIKKPMTDDSLTLILKELNKLATDDDTKIQILNKSIMSSWQGVFPLKEVKQPIEKSNTERINKYKDVYINR